MHAINECARELKTADWNESERVQMYTLSRVKWARLWTSRRLRRKGAFQVPLDAVEVSTRKGLGLERHLSLCRQLFQSLNQSSGDSYHEWKPCPCLKHLSSMTPRVTSGPWRLQRSLTSIWSVACVSPWRSTSGRRHLGLDVKWGRKRWIRHRGSHDNSCQFINWCIHKTAWVRK